MERTARVFLADGDRNFLELLQPTLERAGGFEVVGAEFRGDLALAGVLEAEPDVLMLNLILPVLDGWTLLERLRQADRLPPTLVVSAFATDWAAHRAARLGAVDFLAKPCDESVLVRRLREAAALPPGRAAGPETLVREALTAFGVGPHLDGYALLVDALRMTLENRALLRGVTKDLYARLAELHGSTPACVERSIRGAVRLAWAQVGPSARDSYFAGWFREFSAPPSNSRFLAAMTAFLETRLERL